LYEAKGLGEALGASGSMIRLWEFGGLIRHKLRWPARHALKPSAPHLR